MKREVDKDKDIKPLCFVVLAGPRGTFGADRSSGESGLEAVLAALEQRDNLHIVSAPVLIAREPQGPGTDSARLDWMCEIKEKDRVEAGGTRRP